VASHRVSRWLYIHKMGIAAETIWLLSRWLTSVDIHPLAVIGKNLRMPHPFGIVIGMHTRVGDDVTILQGVTLGVAHFLDRYSPEDLPVIEDGVTLGAGCKVLGRVHIGAHAVVGANAVVISDVPADSTAVGIPAKVLPKWRSRNDSMRGSQ